MPLFVLDKELSFPPVHLTGPDGLLALGGDLSPKDYWSHIAVVYFHGTRGIIYYGGALIPALSFSPGELKIHKSLKPLLKRDEFEFTVNKAFKQVINQCKKIRRPGQEGTWITDEVEKAFIRMHELGYAHSAEVWRDGELTGGLYGIKMGRVFFGESMFSKESNASRYAFIKYIQQLTAEGIELIDCQVYTEYLESFGAKMIVREDFVRLLDELIPPLPLLKVPIS